MSDLFARIHKDQKVFYVGSTNGNTAFSGRRVSGQKATIAQALALTTASRGDIILVDPFHTETTTAVMTLNKIGVTIKGLQLGNQRPVVTLNGAVDMFSFEAAACEINGIDMTIVTTDAATALVNFAAAKCKLANCKMIPSATSVNVVDAITMASGGDDAHIDNVEIYNTTVAVNSFLNIEAAVARMKMTNCHFFGDVATAGIIDAAVVATQINWHNNRVGILGTTLPAVVLDGNPTGVVDLFFGYGTIATLASVNQWGNALRLSRIHALEETDASVQASSIIPALDTN